MSKPLKLFLAIFVGLDVFIAGYFGLAQLRLNIFGEGAIPGGGSALDMALFLLPLFLAYVAADRLYYFLNYSHRQAARLAAQKQAQAAAQDQSLAATAGGQSVWDDDGWEDKTSRDIG